MYESYVLCIRDFKCVLYLCLCMYESNVLCIRDLITSYQMNHMNHVCCVTMCEQQGCANA